MLEMSQGLQEALLNLRNEWTENERLQIDSSMLREWIVQYGIGQFVKMEKMGRDEMAGFLKEGEIAGVDGSSAAFGGSYPGTMTLLQAGAMTTRRKKYLLGDVLTPMCRRDSLRIKQYMERLGSSLEEAYSRYKEERMASLEVEAALHMLKRDRPALVLFDGGFVRYESRASEPWQEYDELARREGILSVGVIEEVGTNFISKALQQVRHGVELPYDRQLLFGVLKPGEVLLLNPDSSPKGFSGRYYTCFARLSSHPSVTGYDIFADRRGDLLDMMRFLYSNTLSSGRGVPFWIDRVDHEIKLSYRETESLIRSTFSAAWVEQFLVSQRTRRDI